MKRRVLLLSSLASLPLSVRAQGTRMPRVGFLLPAQAEPSAGSVRDHLRRLGHIEGRDITYEIRAVQGQLERLPALAQELVRLPVDVIVAQQTPAVTAAMRATRSIPIVMSAGDPVRTGIVASLARPGGNVTGVSGNAADLGPKLLSLLREAFGRVERIGVLANDTDPFTASFIEQLQAGERATGVTLHVVRVPPAGDYAEAFATFERLKVQAVVVQPSLQLERAIARANSHRMPSASPLQSYAAAGGVISYAASQREVQRKLAEYVDRILKGAKPEDLPVEQPTEYVLVVNLKAARAMGVEVARSAIVRADELIE